MKVLVRLGMSSGRGGRSPSSLRVRSKGGNVSIENKEKLPEEGLVPSGILIYSFTSDFPMGGGGISP